MNQMKTRKVWNKKGVSPAISAVIMTGIIVALVSVALVFASNFLLIRIAESEYSSAKQFMQTLALQIDDVAWVPELTETLRYASSYASVAVESALNYTIYVNTTTQSNIKFYTTRTNIVCFNMPVSKYSLGDNYFEPIFPSSNEGFLSQGASSPVARVFTVEKLPMADGSFIRVVVNPTLRMLNLTIGDSRHIRLYLPVLVEGQSPREYDTLTLTGKSLTKIGESVTGIRVEASFPEAEFDNFFFHFPQTAETIALSGESVLELYIGEVDVKLGVHA